jgi:hypothetical protein
MANREFVAMRELVEHLHRNRHVKCILVPEGWVTSSVG